MDGWARGGKSDSIKYYIKRSVGGMGEGGIQR